jgi:transcription termination factor NusB
MWTKAFRKSLISAIYEDLFSESLESFVHDEPSWFQIIEENESSDDPMSLQDLMDVFDFYRTHKSSIISTIKPLMTTWHKTFDLVKACLVCFCVEVMYTKENNQKLDDGIVGKYIRLTQSFAGGENPALVHAVTSKLMQHYAVN